MAKKAAPAVDAENEFDVNALPLHEMTDLAHGVKCMRVTGGVIYYAQGAGTFVADL